MKIQNSKTTSKIFTIAFIVAIFILFFISSLSYRQTKALRDSEKWVTHTFTVKLLLEQLFSAVKDAETAQRGFIITKDSSFLQPYYNTHHQIDSIYNRLEILTRDNITQQQNLAKLKPIINRRFELLREKIDDIRNNKYNVKSDTLRAKMFMEKLVMDMLRQHLNEIIKSETDILARRQEAHAMQLNITPFFSLLLLLFSLIMFIAAFYKINNDVEKLSELNNALLLNKKSFEHAEEIANISHWQWILETDQLSYSDNQYLLLGCQPGEFEPTHDNFLQFVHPDDRHLVTGSNERALREHQTPDIVFRIMRKDGMLRYFKSTGKIYTDNTGRNIIIGINCDITETFLASKALEDKNKELVRSNIELASFNHVASHDLQEPLRKIQLFISRISDDKSLDISEKNMDYFKRIQASAGRMQILINDLLSYSRVNGTDNTFEKTDLNVIIETVLNELAQAQSIEEKDATIHYSNLPEVEGIPFQLKQLFTNLIGNSLKYCDASRPLLINIESSVVEGSSIPHSNAVPDKKYHKISVSDNGLGFEQKYADQIFTLFQRLHDKQTFSGTGIGLAICKKVVENHHGFIIATGMPDQGAIFDIYIPLTIS